MRRGRGLEDFFVFDFFVVDFALVAAAAMWMPCGVGRVWCCNGPDRQGPGALAGQPGACRTAFDLQLSSGLPSGAVTKGLVQVVYDAEQFDLGVDVAGAAMVQAASEPLEQLGEAGFDEGAAA